MSFIYLGLTVLAASWLFCGLFVMAMIWNLTTWKAFLGSYKTIVLGFLLGPAALPGILSVYFAPTRFVPSAKVDLGSHVN